MKNRKHTTTHSSGIRKTDKHSCIFDLTSRKIHENPSNSLAYFARGREEKSRGNTQAAIRDYTFGLRLDTRNAIAFFNRAKLYMQVPDYKSAIADLIHAIAIDPKLMNAYLERADAYKFTGKYAEAIIDYSVVIIAFPDCTIAWLGRRDAKFLQNDLRGALDDHTIASNLISFGTIANEIIEQAISAPTSVNTAQPNNLKTGFSTLKKYYPDLKKYYPDLKKHYPDLKKCFLELKDKLFPVMNIFLLIPVLQLNDFLLDNVLVTLIETQ